MVLFFLVQVIYEFWDDSGNFFPFIQNKPPKNQLGFFLVKVVYVHGKKKKMKINQTVQRTRDEK